FVRGCLADSRTPRWTRLSARVAGGAAFYLPRGSRSGESEDAPEAGLPVPHHLGCHWQSSGNVFARRVGGGGQSSRCLGVWSGGSEQWHGGDAGDGARVGRTAEVGLEAEADDCDRKLGRGRRRTDWFHRVGRRSR